jgi:hypothetical protein
MVSVDNLDDVQVIMHTQTRTPEGQLLFRVEILPPFYFHSADHMQELMEIWKTNRPSTNLRPFTYALHGFYTRLLSDFTADTALPFSPIYLPDSSKSVHAPSENGFTPSNKSLGSKVNLSHTPSKVFDTAPASSPRHQKIDIESSSQTESEDGDVKSAKYSPSL